MSEENKLPAYKVARGTRKDGSAMILRVDVKHQKTLDSVIPRVVDKNWDYVAIFSGYSGAGKSTIAQTTARYLCRWFDEKYIAFTAEEFIRITNQAPEYSAVILDESFESLNTKVGMSPAFLKILNHLQIIRQKHLFILICLPNFFDLSKTVAIFRASHLFVVYADEEGNRGRFLAFDRDAKRMLYIKGSKYLDYNAHRANYFGQFWQNNVVDEKKYEMMKHKHLNEQIKYGKAPVKTKTMKSRNNYVKYLRLEIGLPQKEIAEIGDIDKRTVSDVCKELGIEEEAKKRIAKRKRDEKKALREKI